MSQNSQPGCRLGPYSYRSTLLRLFVIGAGIVLIKLIKNTYHASGSQYPARVIRDVCP
jgi:hypothetical protein